MDLYSALKAAQRLVKYHQLADEFNKMDFGNEILESKMLKDATEVSAALGELLTNYEAAAFAQAKNKSLLPNSDDEIDTQI